MNNADVTKIYRHRYRYVITGVEYMMAVNVDE